jgi:hypothetical protein
LHGSRRARAPCPRPSTQKPGARQRYELWPVVLRQWLF